MYGSTVLPASELQTWAARAKFSRKERPPSIRFVRPGEGKEGFDRGRAAPKGIIVNLKILQALKNFVFLNMGFLHLSRSI